MYLGCLGENTQQNVFRWCSTERRWQLYDRFKYAQRMSGKSGFLFAKNGCDNCPGAVLKRHNFDLATLIQNPTWWNKNTGTQVCCNAARTLERLQCGSYTSAVDRTPYCGLVWPLDMKELSFHWVFVIMQNKRMWCDDVLCARQPCDYNSAFGRQTSCMTMLHCSKAFEVFECF